MAENVEYKSVLEALRAKRDALDVAIKEIEALSGESVSAIPATPGTTRQPQRSEIQHDTFVGMSVAEAAARYLEMVGRPARTLEEITNALNRGGLNSNQGSVQTLLSRSHNGPNPVIRRVGRGTWGLPEWYETRHDG